MSEHRRYRNSERLKYQVLACEAGEDAQARRRAERAERLRKQRDPWWLVEDDVLHPIDPREVRY